jgi:antitoxin PrlF
MDDTELPRAYPYIAADVRTVELEISARLTSKGQITIPSPVRKALGLHDGDRVVFRVDGDRAVLARTPDLLRLAGSIAVPAAIRGAPWSEIIDEAHRVQALRRR